MRALRFLSATFALIAAVVFGFPDSAHAQAGSAAPTAGSERLGFGGAGRFGLTTRQRSYVPEAEPLDADAGPPIYPPSPYYYGYAPWWAAPRSIKYKRYYYPQPGYNEPRLGLHAYDAYSWEMGLQLPVDSDPLPAYVPGQVFEGMVGRRLRARAEKDRLKGRDRAIELMRAGEYRKAGLLLADRFRNDDSPRYPLLLAEVFVSLGKHQHAQLLLVEALRSPSVVDYLPRSVAAHFPDEDAFDAIVKKLPENENLALLRGYFLLHSRTPDAGLEVLRTLVLDEESPASDAAGILYRHYLAQVFKAASTDEE